MSTDGVVGAGPASDGPTVPVSTSGSPPSPGGWQRVPQPKSWFGTSVTGNGSSVVGRGEADDHGLPPRSVPQPDTGRSGLGPPGRRAKITGTGLTNIRRFSNRSRSFRRRQHFYHDQGGSMARPPTASSDTTMRSGSGT